jgi:hypothetical protein
MIMEKARTVAVERGKLAPFVDRISGRGTREDFWGAFDGAAGRFALDRIEITEFRAVVNELMRDASGTAAQQDHAADVAGGREWPVMPVDGSGRMGAGERVVVALTAVACTLVLLWVAFLGGLFGSPEAAPARYGSGVVSVDTDALPSADCWYEVTLTDADGSPGGAKTATAEPLCP